MENILYAFRNLGSGRILALFLGLAAVVSILGMVIENVSKPGMALLYGGLTPAEASQITGALDGKNVPYEIRNDGSVYVPANRVGELRLDVAGAGLVGTGSGYEIFDDASAFGTTTFVQNINARRALEGELSRTIMSLPAIQSARVHVVLPKQNMFSKQKVSPSAAVSLSLGSRQLEEPQINSITQLIAAAVPNLSPNNITIIDQRGTLLYNGSVHDSGGAMASKFKGKLEKNYEQRITLMLEKVTGPGKVSVQVTAEVNMDELEEQSELFDPEQQVVRSEQKSETITNNTTTAPSGAAGVAGNIPGGGASGGAGSQENQTIAEETVNYEISKTVRNLIRKGGEITKLSVAVLIEGKYQGDAEEGNEATYVPYSDNELAQFRKLVETGIGFDKTRGDTVEIIDMPFATMPAFESIETPFMSTEQIMDLVKQGLLILGIIMIIFLVIKPALSALGTPSAGAYVTPELESVGPVAAATTPASTEPVPDMINMEKVEGRVRESTVKKVTEIIDQHPEESLSVVRNWMAGDGGSTNDQEKS